MSWPRRYVGDALLLSCVGVLAVLLLVWAYPADRDSSRLNRGWNGLSEASDALNATPLLSYDTLADVPLPATLLLIPRLPLEEEELGALDEFTTSGGTVVLMDDFGYGNDVLAHLGIAPVFQGAPLLDPLYCYRNASMPRVEFSSQSAPQEPGVMVLNDATWLVPAAVSDVWAWSSYFSYGDVNGDGNRGAGEPDGPLPVGATIRVGAGRVVVVSDSSLLLNSMVELGSNIDALATFVAGDVLVDQVHQPEARVDRSKDALGALRSALGGGSGVIFLVVLVFGVAVGYAWYNRGRQKNDRLT